ncbi:MAG: hypothetical protein H6Q49_629 [Deltaproteobacteria bacterium]|nr:hypothetical protein [Deltaproteobacteria bacterium]
MIKGGRKMKNNIGLTQSFVIALLFISVVVGYQPSCYASPPESLQLVYNKNTQTLIVNIAHDTMLKGSHFIKYVEIKKNGAVVSINKYESQPTGDKFSYSYKIPAIEEDTFQVTATCTKKDSVTSPLYTVR